MAYIDDLMAQASAAVNAGADRDEVEKRLFQLMQQAGYSPEAPKQPKVDKQTKADYKNTVVPEIVQDMNTVQNSPNPFGRVESGVSTTARTPDDVYFDTTDAQDKANEDDSSLYHLDTPQEATERRQAQRGLLGTAVGSLKGTTATTAQGLLRAVPTDWAQDTASGLKSYAEEQNYNPEHDPNYSPSRRIASIAGGVASAAAPMAAGGIGIGLLGMGQGGAAAERAVDEGASPEQAIAYGTTQGALFPILSKIAPSIGSSLGARVASGAGIGAATGIGQRALSNAIAPESLKQDILDPWALGSDVALGGVFGAAGGKARLRETPSEGPTPRTGDSAIDAGIKAFEDIAKPVEKPTEYEQAAQEAWSGKSEEPVKAEAEQPVQEPTITKEDLAMQLKAAKGSNVDFLDAQMLPDGTLESPFFSKGSVPKAWSDKLQDGTLSVNEVFSDVANNKNGDWHPEISNYAKHVLDLSEKLGGGEAPYKLFSDDDVEHNAYMAQKELENKPQPAGYYSRNENMIRINPDQQSLHVFLHEGTHAVTSRALEAGQQGKLEGASKAAFDRLNDLYHQIKPYVSDAAVDKNTNRPLNQIQTYGLTNLHEFVTELFTNPGFRNHLKSIPFDKVVEGSEGRSKARFVVLRNAYDAVVGAVRNLLGLSPKADNLVDAAISASTDYFNKFDPNSGQIVNGAQNLELPPQMPHQPLPQQPDLARPRGRIESLIREAALAKGNVPELHDVAESAKDIQNVSKLKSTALINTWNKYGKDVDVSHIAEVLENRPNAKLSFQTIQAKSPELAESLKDFMKGRQQGSYDIVNEIMRNPNSTPADYKVGATILKLRNEWLTRSFAANETKQFTPALFRNAEKGNASAVDIINKAKNYLKDKWLPGIADLDQRNITQLRELYRQHVGLDPDQMLAKIPEDMQKQVMINSIASKLSDITDQGQWLENAVRDAAGLTKNDVTGLGAYYKSIRLGDDALATRTKVPQELQKLWGVAEHPIIQAAKSIERQASVYAQLKAQNDFRETGLDSGLLTDKPDTATHTVQLSGDAYGPLQGLYTTPHVAQALHLNRIMSSALSDVLNEAIADTNGRRMVNKALNLAGSTWVGLARIAKANVILGNPGNPIMDFVGSPMERWSNGNFFSPQNGLRGAAAAMRDILPEERTSLHPDNELLRKLGLAESNPIGDMRAGPRAAETMKYLDAVKQSGLTPDVALKKMWEAGKIPVRIYTDLYGLTHSWAKYANFFDEKDFWTDYNNRHNLGWTEDQINDKVADIIKHTNISMNMVPKLIRAADLGGATMLGKYYQQVLVNPIRNIVSVGFKDVKDGIQTSDPKLMLHGLKRIVGSGMYMGIGNAMYAYLAKSALGLVGLAATKLSDDDPRKKYIDQDSFLSSGEPMIVSDKEHPESGEITFNVDRPNPFGPVVQLAHRLTEAIGHVENGDMDAAKQSAGIAARNFKDFFAHNSLIDKIVRVAQGKLPTMASQSPDRYSQELDFLSDYMSPSKANALMTLQSVAIPSVVNKALDSENIQGSTKLKALIASGAGTRKFDVGADIQKYLGHKLNSDITQARQPYMELLKSNIPTKPDKIEDAFKEGLKDVVLPYEKMVAAVDAAKAQGLSDKEVRIRLLKSGLNQEVAGMVLANKPVPVLMMMGDPESTLIQQIQNENDPERKQKLIKQASEKMKVFGGLIKKYRTTTMEQLKDQLGVLDYAGE